MVQVANIRLSPYTSLDAVAFTSPFPRNANRFMYRHLISWSSYRGSLIVLRKCTVLPVHKVYPVLDLTILKPASILFLLYHIFVEFVKMSVDVIESFLFGSDGLYPF